MNTRGGAVHCGHCPVRPGQRCQGMQARRLCELADPAHPDHNPAYRGLLVRLGETGGTSQAAIEPEGTAQRRGLAKTLALLDRMRDCPARTPQTDCGCAGLARCGLGRGRQGLVNHHDCLDCLDPNPPE